VTGTPGTGKTTMSTALAEATQLNHINIGDLVKEKNLHDGWDDELDSYILNEDLVSHQFLYLRSLAHPLAPKNHVIPLIFNPFASILNHSLLSLFLITTFNCTVMIKEHYSSNVYVYIFHGFCRCVMNLRMLWKREGTLWTIMAVISFLSDGLTAWLYFKLKTLFCMTV
jgi:hypothetical protein